MKTDSKARPIPAEEIAHAFDNDLAGADSIRGTALEGLGRWRNAKTRHLEREHARAAAELGAEHPEVIELKNTIQLNEELRRDLKVEAERVKTVFPNVDAQGWILHGHVRDQNSEGQPGLTVALYDARGRWIEALGYACTNPSGYYKLSYDRSSEPAATARKAFAAATAGQQTFLIRVTNRKEEVLHEGNALSIRLGEVEYRDIILGTGCGCTPPQGDSNATLSKQKELPPAGKPAKSQRLK